MRRKNETLNTASGALFTHFYAIKIQKYFAWWVFGPIPTSGANFTGIGLGDRTWVLRSLIFCLLNILQTETYLVKFCLYRSVLTERGGLRTRVGVGSNSARNYAWAARARIWQNKLGGKSGDLPFPPSSPLRGTRGINLCFYEWLIHGCLAH